MLTDWPEGWRKVKLGEILTVSSGSGINVRALKGGEYPVYGGNGINGYHSSYILEEPKLIIGRVGVKCGVTHITKGKSWVTDNALIVEPKTDDFNLKFFQHKLAFENLNKLSVSTAQPVISGSKIYAYEILLPPLNAQKLIVSKIEELFSELDKGVEQLKTAQQQLKVYRQAVLKYAFEGRLTSHPIENAGLPTDWRTMPFGSITQNFDGKRVPLSKEVRAKRKGAFRYYGATEVVDYIDDFLFDGEYLLIGEDGANLLSKSRPLAFVASGKFWVNNHAHVVQCKKGYHLEYLCYYFNSLNLSPYVTGSAQPKLTQANLNKIPVPVCDYQQQLLIVQEIETRLSVADKLEETINNSLFQAESLRQSILKKAFEGKLLSRGELESIKELIKSVAPAELKIAAEPQATYEKKKSNDLFPKKIEAIKDTDLHAGILAMVIDAHEKSPEHHLKLSHVKGEKIAHLVEAHIGIDLGRNPRKDAAGPDDFPHLKKVESRAMKAGWFGVKKLRVGQTYVSKRGMTKIVQKVKETLSPNDLQQIEKLIRTFLPFELEHAEVIATLYAAWNNLLLEQKNPTDAEIVYEARENWSKRKLGIEREIFFKALQWMKEHGYVAEGKGRKVK